MFEEDKVREEEEEKCRLNQAVDRLAGSGRVFSIGMAQQRREGDSKSFVACVCVCGDR